MREYEQFLLIAVMVAGAGSVFLFIWGLYRFRAEVVEATALDEERRRRITTPLFRLLIMFARPIGILIRFYVLRAQQRERPAGHKPFVVAARERAERNLTAAGNPNGINADEFLGLVVLCALIGMLVGATATVSTGWTLLLAAGLICGALWPLTWLRSQVRKRKTQIFRALPFALDLLTLSVEAGLDFTSALARIVAKIRDTPLGHEFNELLRQIQMGQARADALRALAWRVDLEEMSSVTSALIQADELGASIGPILRIQAEQMRVRREQIAEKRAMEAPVKILFPLILFIFPTVFLTIFSPIVLYELLERGIIQRIL